MGTEKDAKKTKKVKGRRFSKTGVIYIKHIPHGFYEDEMRGYFSQFGRVLKVRVARSEKTGNSRGYGYIQFEDEEVARIAAETMNNYLMFERIIKSWVVPPEKVKKSMFAAMHRRPGYLCPGKDRREASINSLAAHKNDQQIRRAKARRRGVRNAAVRRLAQLGIGWDPNTGDVQEIEPVIMEPKPGRKKAEDSESLTPAVLEVDASDEEITFKTPPNTVKRVKRSATAGDTPVSKASTPASEAASGKAKRKLGKPTKSAKKKAQVTKGKKKKVEVVTAADKKGKKKAASVEVVKARRKNKNASGERVKSK